MMPPKREHRNLYMSLSMMFEGMIAASPLSPDEYAMRIATQTESALICKEYSSPIHCLSDSGVPGTTENAFSDGRALKVHTVRGVVQTDHHRAVFGRGKTRYRSSGRLCRVSSDFSTLSAACFFWPVRQCTGHLRVWFLVDDHY
ncbi:hypothetical protein TNCV_869221 [Trichonephila clavipes]|nr:hypothetical protein TNCV_869221 [Trichonephila clavipes]